MSISALPGSKRFFAVPLADLSELAFSVDTTWVGIDDESAALIFPDDQGSGTESSSERPTVFVVIYIPSRSSVAAYGVLLGARNARDSVRAADEKQELPKRWNTVVRVGWMRVAECKWVDISSFNRVSQSAGVAHATWFETTAKDVGVSPTWKELPEGENVIAAIDAVSRRVLPHDLQQLYSAGGSDRCGTGAAVLVGVPPVLEGAAGASYQGSRFQQPVLYSAAGQNMYYMQQQAPFQYGVSTGMPYAYQQIPSQKMRHDTPTAPGGSDEQAPGASLDHPPMDAPYETHYAYIVDMNSKFPLLTTTQQQEYMRYYEEFKASQVDVVKKE